MNDPVMLILHVLSTTNNLCESIIADCSRQAWYERNKHNIFQHTTCDKFNCQQTKRGFHYFLSYYNYRYFLSSIQLQTTHKNKKKIQFKQNGCGKKYILSKVYSDRNLFIALLNIYPIKINETNGCFHI